MVPAACSRWRWLFPAFLLVLGLPLSAVTAPLGTSITYQGTLLLDGTPTDGVYDLQLSVWDDAVAGAVLATTAVDDLEVADGIVNATVDLGDVYDGTALWLEVAVRDGTSTGAYTVVAPRQRLRPAPEALYASAADHAGTADAAVSASDVSLVGGMAPAELLAFGSLTGVPGDLTDGDADLLSGLACAPGDVVVWGAGAWECGPDRGGWRTLVVGPVGDAAANGAALLAAVAMLPTPPSDEDGWRVRLEPGLYDLGTSSLVMKPWTVLTGSGENGTVVTSSHCTAPGEAGGTVVVAAGALLERLAVENTCANAGDNGVAVWVEATSTFAVVQDLTARAVGSPMTSAGLVSVASGARLHRITASATGASSANVAMTCGATALVTDCTGTASGGDLAVGLAIGSQSELDPARVVVNRGTFTSSGATATRALAVASADADLALLSLSGAEGIAIDNAFGNHEVHVSRLTSTGPVTVDRSDGALEVTISQSRVVATGAAIVSTGLSVPIRVAATQLWGGAPTTSATCAGVWDENWVFYPSTCP